MSDSTVLANVKGSGSEMTEEEYRALCKKLRQHQLKKGGKKRNKPLLKPIGEVVIKQLSIKVQKSPCDWDDIKIGTAFSLDAEGTNIYTKTGKERAVCLNSTSSLSVGGASVYRIFF